MDQEGDKLPLDAVLLSVLDETRIATLLMPLPNFARQRVAKPGGEANKRQQQTIENLHAEVKRLKVGKWGERFDKPGKGERKGGSKGGSKSTKGLKKERRNVPKELIGMSSVADGKPVCYDYNMKHGCSTTGESRCDEGEHRCAYPGCQGEHSLTQCSKKA